METIADQVTLREITAETVRAVTKLAVTEYQNRFVASNAVSLAQALFAPEAWYRAIYLGEEPVGFVMLEDESLRDPIPENPQVGVWRLMVDAKHQRKGVGRAAMLLVSEHVRLKGLFMKLAISYIPEEGGPEQLYLSLGFRPTGETDEDESRHGTGPGRECGLTLRSSGPSPARHLGREAVQAYHPPRGQGALPPRSAQLKR